MALGIMSFSQIETAQAVMIKQRIAHNFRESQLEDGGDNFVQLQSRISRPDSLNLAQLQMEAYSPDDEAAV